MGSTALSTTEPFTAASIMVTPGSAKYCRAALSKAKAPWRPLISAPSIDTPMLGDVAAVPGWPETFTETL